MKLVTYSEGGNLIPGILVGESVVGAAEVVKRGVSVEGLSYGSAKEIISTAGADEFTMLDAAAREAVAEVGMPAGDLTLAPPIPDPQKILCIGLNYASHVAEASAHNAPLAKSDPVVFAKFPTSLIGHGGTIELPKIAPHAVDWEGELAVIIGRACRRVSAGDALAHVAGYTMMNDVSARDLQTATPEWTRGKAFDTSAPCGPALVTADEIPDPQALELKTILNGNVVQSASTSQMIHSIARLIEFISSAITLVPGDIIATGTPSGVGGGRRPMLFMTEGDTVTVSVSGLGELTNPVRDER